MNINDVPKYVINLKKRTDRLEHIQKEMKYIGWDYELFEAFDEGSHVGCAKSHLGVIKDAIEKNYESVLVIEDDCTFMPYSKFIIEKIAETTQDLEFAVLNLSPTLNRPINQCKNYPFLSDITNLPEKQEHHRDIFATNMILYHKSIYLDLLEITGNTYFTPHYHAIDEFIFKIIMSKKQSYCPILPIAPQIKSYSDVSQGEYSNFYTQTYNWNVYSPIKIPNEFLDFDKNQEIKKEGKHLEIII